MKKVWNLFKKEPLLTIALGGLAIVCVVVDVCNYIIKGDGDEKDQ